MKPATTNHMICLAVIEWMKLIELPGCFNGSKLINERLANFFESPGQTETLVAISVVNQI